MIWPILGGLWFIHWNFTSSKPPSMIQKFTCVGGVREVWRSVEIMWRPSAVIHISGSDASMRRMAAEAPCFGIRFLESRALYFQVIGILWESLDFDAKGVLRFDAMLGRSWSRPSPSQFQAPELCCIRSLSLEHYPLLALMNASLADQISTASGILYWLILTHADMGFAKTVPESLALQGARPSQPPALCLSWQVFFPEKGASGVAISGW